MLLVLITLFMIVMCRSEVSEDDLQIVPYELLMKQGAAAFYQAETNTYTAMVYDNANDHLIVGATNHLFQLKYTTTALKKIEEEVLTPSQAEVEYCNEREGNKPQCGQYGVKWLYIRGRDLYICGAKAYTPACEVRSVTDIKNKVKDNLDEENKAPSSPSTKTAYHVVNNKLYAGISIDDDGDLGGIILSDLTDPYFNAVQTIIPKGEEDTVALSWMNSPEFVGTFEDDKFVYFVFREIPLENPSSIELGIMYSRIGRICKNDQGGQSGDMAGIMVSFVKATITCPGYDIVHGMYYDAENKVLYTSFTNQRMDGSGICLYEFPAIERAFSGKFKYRRSDSQPWVDVERTNPDESNEPQVETCFGPRAMSDARNLHLMSDVIAPSCGKPVYQLKNIYFSSVYVSLLKTGERKLQAGLTGYFGDSQGKIWKFSLQGCEQSRPVEIWHATPTSDSPINSIIVFDELMHVLTYSGVTTLPFHKIGAPPPERKSIQVQDEEAEEDYELDEVRDHKKVTPPFFWPKSHQQKRIAAVRSHGIKRLHSAPYQVTSLLAVASITSAFQILPIKIGN